MQRCPGPPKRRDFAKDVRSNQSDIPYVRRFDFFHITYHVYSEIIESRLRNVDQIQVGRVDDDDESVQSLNSWRNEGALVWSRVLFTLRRSGRMIVAFADNCPHPVDNGLPLFIVELVGELVDE